MAARLVAEGLDAGDEVFGFAEAGGGDAAVLFVGEGHALAGSLEELLSDGFVSDREVEYLWGDSGLGGHVDFAFPGFAEPAFVGDFLELAGTLAGGITEGEGDPDPGGESDPGNEDEAEDCVEDRARSRSHDAVIVPQIRGEALEKERLAR